MMMGVGGGELHQLLKNLCINTDWKYAVFWKLNHQAQKVLTWEDSYFNNNEKNNRSMSNNLFDNMDDNLGNEQYTQDLLELAVAKMSCRVYSIGEGIVGRVAATGKHLWAYGNQLSNSLCSLDEHFDGLKTQFTAGIRTIVVIAVPHGVVQLGSLKNIREDLKLVNYIQEIFFDLQSSLIASTNCSPCVTELSTSSSYKLHEHVNNQDKPNTWTNAKKIRNHQETKNPLSDFIESTFYNDQNRNLFIPTTSKLQSLTNFETEINESFKFPAGCELYEVLGPISYNNQKNSFKWETVMPETLKGNETLQETSKSDLLEAVVVNACCSDNDDKGSTSYGQSVKSSILHPPLSDILTNEKLDKIREPVKVVKKRARPGESCRPRPRDRQLIQDRLKELRQLVPNGSKCSIDSLLERTIKHMVFMQSVTRHADKIDKCAEFKLLGKEKGIQGAYGHEQGSSWAMEVGNQLKLCPIIVENIGVHGQLLVEMMCDECVHFLEMTEAIRSLGLTILKGATDAYGDKTWMCFIVEGENNRSMHRVDILWSLIQILQLKTKTSEF